MYQGHNFSVKIKHVILPRMIALLLGKINCNASTQRAKDVSWWISFILLRDMRRSKDSPFNFESITSFLLGFLSEILPKLQADKKSKELSAQSLRMKMMIMVHTCAHHMIWPNILLKLMFFTLCEKLNYVHKTYKEIPNNVILFCSYLNDCGSFFPIWSWRWHNSLFCFFYFSWVPVFSGKPFINVDKLIFNIGNFFHSR